MLFGRGFHPVRARAENTLALVKDNWTAVWPGTTRRFCSVQSNALLGPYLKRWSSRYVGISILMTPQPKSLHQLGKGAHIEVHLLYDIAMSV